MIDNASSLDMNDTDQSITEALNTFAAAFNLLGSCYRIAPSDDALAPALAFFATTHWQQTWPVHLNEDAQSKLTALTPPTLSIPLAPPMQAQLEDEWMLLFVGPTANPAPPWGSVYLDVEQVLQGSSTQKLNAFLKREQLELNTDYPEPSDHIGLMLFQAAFLAAQGRDIALNELLKEHVIPWLPLYLAQQQKVQASAFYLALTELTLITVKGALQATTAL